MTNTKEKTLEILQNAGCTHYIQTEKPVEEFRLRLVGKKQTGIAALDEALGGGLEPGGVTILNGATSAGKTTFALTLATNMAANGTEVLYFAFEQSKLEIVSKIASRLWNEQHPEAAITAAELRWGDRESDSVEAYGRVVDTLGDRLKIFDRSHARSAQDIADICKVCIEEGKGQPPIVFVDYLQLLEHPDPAVKHANEFQVLDISMSILIDLAKDNLCPVFAISSVASSGAEGRLTVYSSKGNGAVAYGGQNVWNLQLSAVLTHAFQSSRMEDQLNILEAAKRELPGRDLTLIIAKGRSFGPGAGPGERIRFLYKPSLEIYEAVDGFYQSTIDYDALSTDARKEREKAEKAAAKKEAK